MVKLSSDVHIVERSTTARIHVSIYGTQWDMLLGNRSQECSIAGHDGISDARIPKFVVTSVVRQDFRFMSGGRFRTCLAEAVREQSNLKLL